MTFKKITALLLLIAVLFSFCSCFSLLKYILTAPEDQTEETPTESETDDETVDHGASSDDGQDYDVLNYTYDESVISRLESRFTQLDAYIAENDIEKYDEFKECYDAQEDDIYYLGDHAGIFYIQFSLDTSKEDISDKYQELSDLRTEHAFHLIGYYDDIYNSVFKDKFYEDWTEEDIEDALILAKLQDDEIIAIRKQVSDLETKFNKLDSSAVDYNDQSGKIYEQIVRLNMQMAAKLGFDSYTEFAYKYMYDRDFTPEDAQKMYQYVKDYIVPLGTALFNKLVNYDNINKVVKDCQTLSDKTLSKKQVTEKLTPYYQKLGGKTPEVFERWLKSYYTSTSKNARDGAFTSFLDYYGFPVCYFSSSYRNLMTFVHEQGHYQAFTISEHSISSYDLCETQSQGNEWLFLSYYGDNYKADYFKYIASYNMYDNALQIALCTCCDAFEQYVYAHPELTAADYDRVFIEQAKAIGVYDFLDGMLSIQPEDYWHMAIVDCSLYYLSYAVSNIPSIELLVISEEEGFETAANIYLSLLEVEEDAGFNETITAAGLDSPFSEEIYKRLYNYFNF